MTTDLLRERLVKLTAVEIDEELAARLASRLAGTNVEVVHADATAMPFDDGRFSAAVSFTMLHHVPSTELQDRLFAEVARVVRPGGAFVASDSVASDELAHSTSTTRTTRSTRPAWRPVSPPPASTRSPSEPTTSAGRPPPTSPADRATPVVKCRFAQPAVAADRALQRRDPPSPPTTAGRLGRRRRRRGSRPRRPAGW